MAHFDAACALWSEAGLHLSDREREKIEIQQTLIQTPDCSFVLVEDGSLVGAVIGASNGRRAWIYHLAVHPKHQHKGYGMLLLKSAEDALIEKGATKIMLGVAYTNLKVAPFYEKYGYTIMNDAMVMNKDLFITH